jgi:hypothetical protein
MRTRCWFIARAAALLPTLVAVASPEATGFVAGGKTLARPDPAGEPVLLLNSGGKGRNSGL